ncbi:hypothetical protein BHE74_00022241 [Ensete ventricosum]|uniref:Uncharacterized protein n=1 Tax=Ensete ventricosum TaxID=4639 RepID=A0A426ZWI9_ENSVE|nr:hypothetical protein B296_00013046 [Ensete ventricosum]RWW70094.1 hypothetical protein BHE74_00022241 [Ensete ventricosum]
MASRKFRFLVGLLVVISATASSSLPFIVLHGMTASQTAPISLVLKEKLEMESGTLGLCHFRNRLIFFFEKYALLEFILYILFLTNIFRMLQADVVCQKVIKLFG